MGRLRAKPIGEIKKGADGGVDGRKYFRDNPNKNEYKEIIIQVKSGHVGVKDIRELITVKNKNNAAIGILVTLEEPTEPMKREALSEGSYNSNLKNYKCHKIQILTVEDLLKGKNIDYISMADLTFKQAEKHIDKLFN